MPVSSLALLLLSLAAHGADYPLPPPPPEAVSFVADHFDYESSSSVIHLKGHVRVTESTITLKTGEAWLDVDKRTARSDGYLLVEDGVSAIYADRGWLDYKNRTGRLERADAGHGDFRVHAAAVSLERGRLTYFDARFTACSYDPKPHYHFRSSRVSVAPRKHLLAYNNVFYLGPVPILYLPVIYQSLRNYHLWRVKLQPGYDRRNGGFLKATVLSEFGPRVYNKLFLDYYGAQGFGAGDEVQFRRGQDSRGAIYGYRIRETSTRRERWTVLGDAYQALTSSIAFQGRLQAQSDAGFNNDYARSSLLRVTPQLVNGAAVVYRLRSATARLSYSRIDDDDGSGIRYLKSRESVPRLDIQTVPLRWGRLPWLNTVNAFADNNYQRGRPFLEKSVGAGWEGTRTINLARGLSLTPRAGYRQAYFNRVDSLTSFASTTTVLGAFVGHYTLEGNIRLATPIGDWDLGHRYDRRQKANRVADDAGAIDHGVEANLTTLQDSFRPTRQVLVRILSGYDFRVFRDLILSPKQRVQPIVGEVIYTPRPALNVSIRDDFEPFHGNRSFLFNAQWGELDGDFIGGGFSHNKALPNDNFVNLELGWKPGKASSEPVPAEERAGWHLTAALRGVITSQGGLGRVDGFRLFEKEVVVKRVFHDFHARVLTRFRPGGVREVMLRVDMRLPSFSRNRPPPRDWEAEWFPERARGAEDRP